MNGTTQSRIVSIYFNTAVEQQYQSLVQAIKRQQKKYQKQNRESRDEHHQMKYDGIVKGLELALNLLKKYKGKK